MMPDPTILEKITSKITTVVWVADQNLSHEIPNFATVDYLLDGLVRKHIAEQPVTTDVSFVHTLFGKNFHVAFANVEVKNHDAFVKSLITLIPEKEREFLVVLNSQFLPKALDQKLDKSFGFVERL